MPFRRIFLFFLFLIPFCPLQAATFEDYYSTGFDLYAHKDYAKSIPYLKAALQLDPQNWKAYQILGYDYYLSNQPDQALVEFDQSLRWHPKNPELWTTAENIRAWTVWDAERRDIYPRVFRNYDIWVQLHMGVMTASLGDLPKAVAAFQNYYTPIFGNATATVDGFGPLAGMEVGFMLDTYNAWGVVFDGAALNGFKASAQGPSGNNLVETLQPNMISVQAEYYHFFKLGRTRLSANAGAGLYNTIAELNAVNDGVTFESGEMAGIGVGGFLGLGWEIAVADQLSASLYGRYRYATTGNIQGSTVNGYGTNQVTVLSTDPNGLLGANPSTVVGTKGYKAVNIDYTGADFGLSITYHY